MENLRSLDYLSFSVKELSTVDDIQQLLGLSFKPLGHGNKVFRQAAATDDRSAYMMSDNIRPDAADSVFFDIRGQGMRAVEAGPGFVEWRETLGKLLEYGCEIRRIDAATDNVSGELKMGGVKEQLENRGCVRKGSVWSEMNEYAMGDRVLSTIYVGKRCSNVMLRIYGKGFQQGEDRDWLRFEFEMKRERAHAWAETLVNGGWDLAWAALRGSVDFRDPQADSNRSRWPVSEWWADLMGNSRYVLTVSKEVVRSIQRTYGFLVRQISKPFARLVAAMEGDISIVDEMISKGTAAFKARDRDIVRRYQAGVLCAD
jgi:DNA relaxase NicK